MLQMQMMLKMGVLIGLIVPGEHVDDSNAIQSTNSFWLATFRQPIIYLLWKFVC